MSSLKATTTSNKIVAKIMKLIEETEYYEAHQLYRTLYFRWTNAKKWNELALLLFDGALRFLEKNQTNSGADLACLYLDVIVNGDKEQQGHGLGHEEILKAIGKLYSLIPARTPERLTFTSKSLKLGQSSSVPLNLIHHTLALVLWREKNYPESRFHFIHSSEPTSSSPTNSSTDDCAQMLVEYHVSCGFPSEADLFIAQYILQVLCLKKNKSNMDKTFITYTAKHPFINRSDPPFSLPLLNFVWFLLLAIDSGKSSTFKVLCDLYDSSIKRDPTFSDYLSQIGSIFFGIENPNKRAGPAGGLFQNLINSLMNDDENESDEEHNEPKVSKQPIQNRSQDYDEELD